MPFSTMDGDKLLCPGPFSRLRVEKIEGGLMVAGVVVAANCQIILPIFGFLFLLIGTVLTGKQNLSLSCGLSFKEALFVTMSKNNIYKYSDFQAFWYGFRDIWALSNKIIKNVGRVRLCIFAYNS